MATEQLSIKIDEKGALVVKRNIENVGKSAKATGGAISLLKKALGALAAVAVVKQLIGLADTFTVLQNKLKIVTTGTENLGAVTDELFEIAKRTRSSFEETANSFSKFALSAKELGRSQQEILEFTELVNKAVIIGGSAASEAKGGLRQLAQGIASGALRGDELISVLENLPFVADTIASSLGITRGALRDLGKEGKITAEVVLDAFKKNADFLNEEYEKTIITVGQAVTLLQNAFLKLIGEFDQGRGASTALAQGILALSVALEALKTPIDFLTNVGTAVFQELMAVLAPLQPFFESLPGIALKAFKLIGLGAIELLRSAVQLIDGLGFIFGNFFKFVDDNWGKFIDGFVQLLLEAVNVASGLIQGLIQGFIKGLNIIRTAVGKSELAELELFQFDSTAAAIAGSRLGSKLADGMANSDLTGFLSDIEDRVAKLQGEAAFKKGGAGGGVGQTAGVAAVVPEGKPEKDALRDAISGLAQEAELLKLSGDARQRRAEIIALENALFKQGKELTTPDREVVEGLIAENQALARQAELKEQILGPDRELVKNLEALDKLKPDLTAEQYAKALEGLKGTLNEVSQSQQILGDSITAVFDAGFDQLRNFTSGGKVLFQEFASAAVDSITQIIGAIVRMQAVKAVSSALGLPAFAHGGTILPGGSGGTDSQIVAFRKSPNEQVDVTTPAQRRAGNSMQTAPPPAAPNFKFVNVLDPALIREAMADEEGTRVIMNQLSRNKTTANRALS